MDDSTITDDLEVSSSSSCSPPLRFNSVPPWKYDVFLSFNGEDTRKNFVDHLYVALSNSGIYTFRDDVELERGQSIAAGLLKAIEDSCVVILVISKGYLASSWCLDELAKAIELHQTMEKIVVPVFYGVDPSDVSKFLKGEIETERNWRDALSQVATLPAWDSRDWHDAILVRNIIQDIQAKLQSALSGYISDVTDDSVDSSSVVGKGSQSIMELDSLRIVGIDSHLAAMDSLLCPNLDDVRIVGVWGMGGVGKTTLARIMYDRLYSQFEGGCFLANVREKFKRDGAVGLQTELLSSLFPTSNFNFFSRDQDIFKINRMLRLKKVLIVLDDVDDLHQLDSLSMKHSCFGSGSRIIITTRDKHLLDVHGVDSIYAVEALTENEAFQLFCQHAFKQNCPQKDFWELSKQLLSYANGLPLALIVLGSFLYGKTLDEWHSTLTKFRRVPHSQILDLLRISYDGLDELEKNVFLDIACFFVGENKKHISDILEGSGFNPSISLRILEEKSLVKIINDKLWMHDLVREMGCEIVRQQSSKEPGRRSRLLDPDDIAHVLARNTVKAQFHRGTENVEGISLDMSEIKEVYMKSNALKKMSNLRLLKFYNSINSGDNSNVKVLEGLKYLPPSLRYLNWQAYPSKSFPLNFPANLVTLILKHSNIKQLWMEKQHLPNLKSLDLMHSRLIRLPDMEAPKLEALSLEGCIDLVEVSGIQYLTNLEYLNLRECNNLESIPCITTLELLRTLDLTECRSLRVLPQLPLNIEYLYLSGTAISSLTPSCSSLSRLLELDISNCSEIKTIPRSILKLQSLKILRTYICSNLLNYLYSGEFYSVLLPDQDFQYGSDEVQLLAWHILNIRLPRPNLHPEYLVKLNLMHGIVEQLWEGKQFFVNLKMMDLNLAKITELPDLSECEKLERLNLQGCISLISAFPIEHLKKVECLNMRDCRSLLSLPSMIYLKLLVTLNLSGCENLTKLPELSSSIKYLHLAGLAITELPTSIGCLSGLMKLDLRNCRRLKRLPSSICDLTSLEYLNVSGCSALMYCF